jgi:hypothetical protein
MAIKSDNSAVTVQVHRLSQMECWISRDCSAFHKSDGSLYTAVAASIARMNARYAPVIPASKPQNQREPLKVMMEKLLLL